MFYITQSMTYTHTRAVVYDVIDMKPVTTHL